MCLRLHEKNYAQLLWLLLIAGFVNLQAGVGGFWRCSCCRSPNTLEVVVDQSTDFMEFNVRVKAVITNKLEAILTAAVESKKFGGRPAVIFDIDGTVFYTDNKTKIEKPIFAVLEFYELLQQENIGCIFLTARLKSIAAETKRHLKHVGYRRWDGFIGMSEAERRECCPDIDGFALNSIYSWKQQKRLELALRYNIIATLDDRPENLKGLCVGIPIKIPPYSILLDDDALDALLPGE